MFFEFVVQGTPMSHQTQNRTRLQAWKNTVRAAATQRWPVGQIPFADQLQIMVDYYHDGPAVHLDGDNLLKPIQDALNHLVYHDDSQIVDARVRKAPLDGNIRVRSTSERRARTLGLGEEFLHVQIADAPIHENLTLNR